MKKVSSSIEVKYKSPHLYKDDLEEIEKILVSNKARRYSVTLDGYEYETLKEALKGKKTITNLEFSYFDPYIYLQLTSGNARLYASNDDPQTLGIFTAIDNIIKTSERKFRFYLFSYGGTELFLFIIILINLFVLLYTTELKVNKSSSLAISIFEGLNNIFFVLEPIAFIWFMIIIFKLFTKKFSKLETINRNEKLNFLQRNKDTLIVAILSALAVSFLTFLLEKVR